VPGWILEGSKSAKVKVS